MDNNKITQLTTLLKSHAPLVVAFSGGIDSSVLAYLAHEALGEDMVAVTVENGCMSPFEKNDGASFCKKHGIPYKTLAVNFLEDQLFVANDPLRCYYCKSKIFSELKNWSKANGLGQVADGTNITDTTKDRPGLKALSEQMVFSPFKEAGFTTEDIIALGKELGILADDKESNSCRATRIETGQAITEEKMDLIDAAEHLVRQHGFTYIRARLVEAGSPAELIGDHDWIDTADGRYKIRFLVARGQENRLEEVLRTSNLRQMVEALK